MPNLLANKAIIVTGAARGLGEAIADLIVQEGGRVLVADILDDTAGPDAETESRMYQHCDVTQADAVRAAVDRAVAEFGRVDGLVNNAGVGITGPFTDLTETQFDKTVAVNLKGVFLFMQYVALQMLKQGGGGAIVNIGSAGSVVGTPELLLYAMSKHGVAGMTRCAGVELADRGIRVNAVCPGPVWTDMMRYAAMEMYGTDDPAEVARQQHVPRGDLGRPREVAEAVAWLLSDRSANCNGSLLMTDGGYTAW
jgi:NAD(P)-dependent dehydrogenase (short-subunit alcohol dehydrogenase family)